MTQTRLVEVRQNVLKHNDVLARELRSRFETANVFVISLVSSPGSGKTAFLEKTLTILKEKYRVAALVGDLETENDALRLARAEVPAKQIITGTICHLEAAMVEKSLEDWDLENLDFLFIENVAYDLHPEYLSTKFALGSDAEKIGVQHHHAHIASCLADNSAEGEVIGVAMDGSGFGIDGKIWGGEFFVADFRAAERVAHLDYIPLPGGAKAIREPWRLAAVYLQKTFGDELLDLNLPFVRDLDHGKWKTIKSMIQNSVNSPETSSMGRLFDAVSSLLGLRNSVNYEGQAAIELETIADRKATKNYEFEIAESGIIKSETVIRKAVEDLLNGVSSAEVSARFHLAVVDLIVKLARQIRDERNLNRIALSGGVFQNMFLLERVCRSLEKEGFEVLTHSRVPTNDGGISLGQAAIANALCQNRLR